MNARIAGHAGTPQLKQFHMVNIKMFRHPKYYKELRKRNKPAGTGGALCVDPEAGSDQAISQANSTRGLSDVRPGPGQTKKATSRKLQAASNKHNQQATSSKQQANED